MSLIHVAAAVIVNNHKQILIAKRPDHVHQGGLWEFPGGKIEQDESVQDALSRELLEELGITVKSAQPLIKIRHDYPEKSVELDVWQVNEFDGEAKGVEGQPIKWVNREELKNYTFPQANTPIITAVKLPRYYLVTPEPDRGLTVFLQELDRATSNDIELIQFRAKTLSTKDYRAYAQKVCALCREKKVKVILNSEPKLVLELNADGVQLSSQRLAQLNSRPLPREYWVGASCHDQSQLKQAENIEADFAVLGSVKKTMSHPEGNAIGWQQFQSLVTTTNLPIYGIGGLMPDDLNQVRQSGGQGIAAINGFWNK